jgi:hypothetical protein
MRLVMAVERIRGAFVEGGLLHLEVARSGRAKLALDLDG